MDDQKTPTDKQDYMVPVKAIKSPDDMHMWFKSSAYLEYMGFISALNESVQGKALNSECYNSPIVTKVVNMLIKFDGWINEIPPTEQPQRFGNQSFQIWHKKLTDLAESNLKEVLPENLHSALPEITVYMLEGFGNPTRIDYGTGHEMAFIMFLCCLFKINAFHVDDKTAVVLKVFNRYLELVRRLQLVYRMEPAGSHGVWSLDDYQFVPFIWGSSQLIGHPQIEPRAFLDPNILNAHSKQYMFLGCINFISKVKTGPFPEHSNQLWNVSAVPSWQKVNNGLIRMYDVEVLSKFPVIQHIHFGSLFSIQPPNRSNESV